MLAERLGRCKIFKLILNSTQSKNYAVKFEFSTPEKLLFIKMHEIEIKKRVFNAALSARSVRKEMNSNKTKIKYFCEQFENFPLILSLLLLFSLMLLPVVVVEKKFSSSLFFHSMQSPFTIALISIVLLVPHRVNIINYKIIYGKSSSCYLHLSVCVCE